MTECADVVTDAATVQDRLSLWRQRLECTPYLEYVNAFSPSLIGTHEWANKRESAEGALGTLVDLLLLGKPVLRSALSEHSSAVEEWQILIDLGVLEEQGDHVFSPSLALVALFGLWLWVERPRWNPTIYIGHDTHALMSRLHVRPGRRALDLCCGPGTQAIHLALRGAAVSAVEVNPFVAEVARLNAMTNECGSKVRVSIGDLYNALAENEAPFDLICANPPLLPFPEDTFYPFVGHGGNDGLAITWQVLRGLPRWLSSNGRAQIIGTAFSDGLLPAPLEQLKAEAHQLSLDAVVTVVGHRSCEVGSPTFEGLAATAAATARLDHATVRERLERLIIGSGGSQLCYFSMLITRGTGQVSVLDMAGERGEHLWYV